MTETEAGAEASPKYVVRGDAEEEEEKEEAVESARAAAAVVVVVVVVVVVACAGGCGCGDGGGSGDDEDAEACGDEAVFAVAAAMRLKARGVLWRRRERERKNIIFCSAIG